MPATVPTDDNVGDAPPENALRTDPQENLADAIVTAEIASNDGARQVYLVITNPDGSIHEVAPASYVTKGYS